MPGTAKSADLSSKYKSGALKKTARIPSFEALKEEQEANNGEHGDHTSGNKELEVQNKNSPFEKEDLDKVWKEFATLRRAQGKAQEQHIFVQPYKISEDGSTISLELNNTLQMDILEGIRSDLVQFLRNKLQNDFIVLETRIKKENSKKKLYTNKEKLAHMAKKNPAVGTLQKKLGLDPDF